MGFSIVRFYQKIKHYWKSHIWCAPVIFSVIFVISSVSMVLYYFRQEYIQYLKDETLRSETTTLISASKNLNYILKDFVSIGSEFATSSELLDKIERYAAEEDNKVVNQKNLNDTLSAYGRYSKWITDIVIVDADEVIFEYDTKSFNNTTLWGTANRELLFQMSENVLRATHDSQIPQYQVGDFFISHPNDSDLRIFSIAFPLKGSNGGDERLKYAIIVSLKAEALSDCFDFISEDRKEMIKTYLSDKDGMIIHHENDQYIGIYSGKYLATYDLNSIAEPIEIADWNLNIAIDETALTSQINAIYIQGIVVFGIIIIMLAVVMILIFRSTLQPIYRIRESMEKVKVGNFTETIPMKGSNELWQMIDEYNKMIIALGEMTEALEQGHQEKLISIKKQHKAEREALESQINSHFICNTLGVINYDVIESGNYKASALIKKLSNILRYTFDQKHQEVYMHQEFLWIEQYLFLQKSRLEDVFDYQIEVDAQFESWPCPKLVLQPFVENTILHGFEGKEEGGFIRIIGKKQGDWMKLTIEDNGSGMPKETEDVIHKILLNPVKKYHKKVGIGISNVAARMRMYFGEGLEIHMETAQGRGTKFTFLIPKPENRSREEEYD